MIRSFRRVCRLYRRRHHHDHRRRRRHSVKNRNKRTGKINSTYRNNSVEWKYKLRPLSNDINEWSTRNHHLITKFIYEKKMKWTTNTQIIRHLDNEIVIIILSYVCVYVSQWWHKICFFFFKKIVKHSHWAQKYRLLLPKHHAHR